MRRCSAIAVLLVLMMVSCTSIPKSTSNGEEILRVGNATISINLPPDLPLPRTVVMEWIHRAAIAVSNYLGRYPVNNLSITIKVGGHEPVGGGVTHGGSRINVRLGRNAQAADLQQDWVMTHEMFHLAFPTLDDRYVWMMEGLSDYLEPIARARAGQLTAEEVWREFVEGLPQGLPMPGDRGLDNTHTRERIYWGGNLYWLLADVQIREKSHNRRSVDDAIRAILKVGGNGSAEWTLDRVLSVGDKATGTTVLKDLYDESGPKPDEVDLDELWQRLGIHYKNGAVTFDDSAPDARIRSALTKSTSIK
jgi:hypothetical protein